MTRASAILALVALALVAVGMVILSSASPVQGGAMADFRLVQRQAVYLVLGLVAAVVASRIDYHHWQALAVPLAVFCLILLGLVLIPGVGVEVKGSRRWLAVAAGVRLQPSEPAKFACIAVLAWWMTRAQRRLDRWGPGLLVPFGILGLFCGLVILEPDFGTTALIGTVGLLIMVVAGARWRMVVPPVLVGGVGFAWLIARDEVRYRRFMAFLHPEQHADTAGYQVLQALYAFVVGGPFGVGLGNSIQKRWYLPEAHTDFIFAILAEELGLVGSFGVCLLYLVFFVNGIRIALRTPDLFGRLLAFGIVMMVTVQAAFNIAVVTGSVPTKGLALPLISYGGSSLVTTLAMCGVLYNLARQGEMDRIRQRPRARKSARNTRV